MIRKTIFIAVSLILFSLIIGCSSNKSEKEESLPEIGIDESVLIDSADIPLPQGWRTVSGDDYLGFVNDKAVLPSGREGVYSFYVKEGAEYEIWVRSHGADDRSFRLKLNDEELSGLYGNKRVRWDKVGDFELSEGKNHITVTNARNMPYLDAFAISSVKDFHPSFLGDLKANIEGDRRGFVGEPIRLNYLGSKSPRGSFDSIKWDLGDGTVSDKSYVEHVYDSQGTYTITLTVESEGKKGTTEVDVYIGERLNVDVTRIPIQPRGMQPFTFRFGDLRGDGKLGFLVEYSYRGMDVYDNSGELLWTYSTPSEEVPPLPGQFRDLGGLIWDYTGDGKAEVVHWRSIDGKEMLVMADGLTGEIIKKTHWPTGDGIIENKLAVANLRGLDEARDILVMSGAHHLKLTAYDDELNVLWSHRASGLNKLGHYIYPKDVTGDGRDEVFLSYIALTADGEVLWERQDLNQNFGRNHMDSIVIADINGNGKYEVVAASSFLGVIALDALTGQFLWTVDANHAQTIAVGKFREDMPGMQIAISDRHYTYPKNDLVIRAHLLFFDSEGNELWRWPEKPSISGEIFGSGWMDDGHVEHLYWSSFRIDPVEGRGKPFPYVVRDVVDFNGNGYDNYITWTPNELIIIHQEGTRDKTRDRDRSWHDYLLEKVVNNSVYAPN